MLTVTVQDLGEEVLLCCQGSIVRGLEGAILCAAVRQSGKKVVLDLSNVETIDAAGVGALITLQAAGIYIRLLNPPDRAREIFRAKKLDSIFDIGEALPGETSLIVACQQPWNVDEGVVM